MGQRTGVGVLDKSVAILEAAAERPVSLADLGTATDLPRATVHRLAVALEVHGLLVRDGTGRFVPGPRLRDLAAVAPDPLVPVAVPVLERLRDATGESAQLYRRLGDVRVCVAAVERPHGLRDTVPVGAHLSMAAGSAAHVLLAWDGARSPSGAAFTARTLATVRRRGWSSSSGEREPGVASVSAPVRDTTGHVVAAVSVSGPVERLDARRAAAVAPEVMAAARQLSARVP